MAQVNFRIDDDVKTDAEALFARLGMNMSTAVNIFIHQALFHRGLPFAIKEVPYYAPENMAHLREVSADYDANRNFAKHDLVEVNERRVARAKHP
jgi:DNA-damage-inducible protein J